MSAVCVSLLWSDAGPPVVDDVPVRPALPSGSTSPLRHGSAFSGKDFPILPNNQQHTTIRKVIQQIHGFSRKTVIQKEHKLSNY